jgi:glycosyltransferase involved in cell wall biosynthesis
VKLIIQIPCLNESETLEETIRDLPREIEGLDSVEVLIIDDGSTDNTSEVARELGVDHIVRFPQNRGLAKGFMAGVDACLKLGADIIVNTDADNQYCGADIPKLVQPILDGKADMVVGDRQVETVEHFSATKKKLQKIGSWVVRLASETKVPDATSGFRALSREAAMRLFVTSEFTYTLETLIQAGHAHLAVAAVPIRTNAKTRESRLFKSISHYLRRSASTIIRIYTMYRPLKAFLYLALLFFLLGTAGVGRFFYFHLTEPDAGHVQSLILAAGLLIVAFTAFVAGLQADLISANRKLLEDTIMRLRRLEYERADTPVQPSRRALVTHHKEPPPKAEPLAAQAPARKGPNPGD